MKRLLALAAGLLLSVSALATQTPVIKDVRFGHHLTFDRMVIDIEGHAPQVKVTKPYSLKHDGSGAPVILQGKGNIQIVLNPAQAHTDDGRVSYDGPYKVADLKGLGMTRLHGFELLGDYEAYVTFGLTTRFPDPQVSVMILSNPTRVVIDVRKKRFWQR